MREIDSDGEENSIKCLWSSLLDEVTNKATTGLPSSKTLVVFGDDKCGKSTLISRLRGPEDIQEGFGIEYFLIEVKDEARDATTNLSVCILDGNPIQSYLLQYVITEDSFCDQTAIIVVSISEPWKVIESLEMWADVLKNHINKLKLPKDKLKMYKSKVSKEFYGYLEPGTLTSGDTNPVNLTSFSFSSMSETSYEATPEPPSPNDADVFSEEIHERDVLNNNLGIPLIVVVTKTDMMKTMIKENEYTEEHFDFIQMHIRRFCLTYGAALFYVSVREDTNCDLLNHYIQHRIYGLPFNHSPYVVEGNCIFIPAGWDNHKKVNILGENLTKINPQTSFSGVIPRPVPRKANNREPEITTLDEQAFLLRLLAIKDQDNMDPNMLRELLGPGGSDSNSRQPANPLKTAPSVKTLDDGNRLTNGSTTVFRPKIPQGNSTLNLPNSGSSDGVLADFFSKLLKKRPAPGGSIGEVAASSSSEPQLQKIEASPETDMQNNTDENIINEEANSLLGDKPYHSHDDNLNRIRTENAEQTSQSKEVKNNKAIEMRKTSKEEICEQDYENNTTFTEIHKHSCTDEGDENCLEKNDTSNQAVETEQINSRELDEQPPSKFIPNQDENIQEKIIEERKVLLAEGNTNTEPKDTVQENNTSHETHSRQYIHDNIDPKATQVQVTKEAKETTPESVNSPNVCKDPVTSDCYADQLSEQMESSARHTTTNDNTTSVENANLQSSGNDLKSELDTVEVTQNADPIIVACYGRPLTGTPPDIGVETIVGDTCSQSTMKPDNLSAQNNATDSTTLDATDIHNMTDIHIDNFSIERFGSTDDADIFDSLGRSSTAGEVFPETSLAFELSSINMNSSQFISPELPSKSSELDSSLPNVTSLLLGDDSDNSSSLGVYTTGINSCCDGGLMYAEVCASNNSEGTLNFSDDGMSTVVGVQMVKSSSSNNLTEQSKDGQISSDLGLIDTESSVRKQINSSRSISSESKIHATSVRGNLPPSSPSSTKRSVETLKAQSQTKSTSDISGTTQKVSSLPSSPKLSQRTLIGRPNVGSSASLKMTGVTSAQANTNSKLPTTASPSSSPSLTQKPASYLTRKT